MKKLYIDTPGIKNQDFPTVPEIKYQKIQVKRTQHFEVFHCFQGMKICMLGAAITPSITDHPKGKVIET